MALASGNIQAHTRPCTASKPPRSIGNFKKRSICVRKQGDSSNRVGVVARNWKSFGPSTTHSDGDAEYYRLSNSLAQQYEWFAPRPDQLEQEAAPGTSTFDEEFEEVARTRPEFGLTPKQILSLGLNKPGMKVQDSSSLSSRNFVRGERFDPETFGFSTPRDAAGPMMSARGQYYGGAKAAYGDYPKYPEGRPLFWPESARYGNPPDLPSLLLNQRVIYISLPFVPSVTELIVAQCYYLDFDDRNRQKPIYVYLNSTGCMNDKGQAIAADNEFYAMWAALGFTRAPLYTGVTFKAQNQAAVLLAAGQKGHRYSFPHASIRTAPPVLNRVFGQTTDAQIQSAQLEYATKYYAAILARATGKPLAQCQKEFLSRKRHFSVKEAYEEGLIDKLVPGYSLNRFQKMKKDMFGEPDAFYNKDKPRFRFRRDTDKAV